MDKKAKKKLEVLRKRQEKTQKLIASAKAQPDDPDELAVLQAQASEIESEIEKLKEG